MKWLTNAHRDDVEKRIADLTYGNDRVLATGNPEPTEAYPVDRLIFEGMVGIYDMTTEEED
jgi:hypothetical protein